MDIKLQRGSFKGRFTLVAPARISVLGPNVSRDPASTATSVIGTIGCSGNECDSYPTIQVVSSSSISLVEG